MLPGLVSKVVERLEWDIVIKLGGLENRMDKELATSHSMEANKSCSGQGKDGNHKQQTSGFERALGSLLQQFSEHLWQEAGNMRLLRQGGWRWKMCG